MVVLVTFHAGDLGLIPVLGNIFVYILFFDFYFINFLVLFSFHFV